MIPLRPGDVLCWDRIWSKPANMWTMVTYVPDTGSAQTLVLRGSDSHDSWKIGGTVNVQKRLGKNINGSGCDVRRVEPDEWPDEISVKVAKWHLMGVLE